MFDINCGLDWEKCGAGVKYLKVLTFIKYLKISCNFAP